MHPFLENFVGFGEFGEVDISRRNLPHWEQAGASYFVTMRLADSIPKVVLQAWDSERRHWLAARSATPETLSALSPEERAEFSRHFTRAMQDYLDRGVGECHLRKSVCQKIVADALIDLSGERYDLGDFVVMPNHLHLLWRPLDGFGLKSLCYDFKKFTARKCNRALGRAGHFWQDESHDRIMRDDEELAAFRHYTHANPTKAMLREGEFYLHNIDDEDPLEGCDP